MARTTDLYDRALVYLSGGGALNLKDISNGLGVPYSTGRYAMEKLVERGSVHKFKAPSGMSFYETKAAGAASKHWRTEPAITKTIWQRIVSLVK